VHPAPERRADTNELQELQGQLASTRSQLADAVKAAVALQTELDGRKAEYASGHKTKAHDESGHDTTAQVVARTWHDSDDDIHPELVVDSDEEDESSSTERARTFASLSDTGHPEPAVARAQGPTPGCVMTKAGDPIEAQGWVRVDPNKCAQDAGVRTNLQLRIAAEPEEFFAHADTNHDGKLSADEWEKACRSFLGNVDSALCRTLFDEMDLDQDGWVSKDEFIEMRNAIRVFLQSSKCQELLVESLASLVAAHWKAGGDDDTSVADKATEILTELPMDEVSKQVAVVLPRRFKERGDEVKREREERKKKLAKMQVEEGEGKFAQLPTAAYGNKKNFHQGLEVIGLPHPNTLEELIKECQKYKDSLDEFEAWNSGRNITTANKELDFVMDPFGFRDREKAAKAQAQAKANAAHKAAIQFKADVEQQEKHAATAIPGSPVPYADLVITESGHINGEKCTFLFDEGTISSDQKTSKWCLNGGCYTGRAWIEISSCTPRVITGYGMKSANDCPSRDPRSWTLRGYDVQGKISQKCSQ